MKTMAIVVVHEGRDGPLEMLPIQDQQPIDRREVFESGAASDVRLRFSAQRW